MRITAEKLIEAGALPRCGALRWFKERWPNGCEATLKNLEYAAAEGMLSWFVNYYLQDCDLCAAIDKKDDELRDVWHGTIGQRMIDSAKVAARRFVIGARSASMTISDLRVFKRTYENAGAVLDVTINKNLVRMVYDKIKPVAAKRRKVK